MLSINRNPLQQDKFNEKNRLRNQLVICLKHHHREVLEQIPLELAANSMIEAWMACHPKHNEQLPTDAPTEVNPKMHSLEAMVHHLHY